MHVYTVVKVRADDPEEAIGSVEDLLTNVDEYSAYNNPVSCFDYPCCDEMEILDDWNEETYQQARQEEIRTYREELRLAQDLPDDGDMKATEMKAYHLLNAADSLDSKSGRRAASCMTTPRILTGSTCTTSAPIGTTDKDSVFSHRSQP